MTIFWYLQIPAKIGLSLLPVRYDAWRRLALWNAVPATACVTRFGGRVPMPQAAMSEPFASMEIQDLMVMTNWRLLHKKGACP